MKLDPACYPCALRRLLSTASRITDDPWLHHKLLTKAMSELADVKRDSTPAEMMHALQALVTSTLGVADPYGKAREEWQNELPQRQESLRAEIDAADDRLLQALTAASRANAFDNECLSKRELRESLNSSADLTVSDLDLLRKDLSTAKQLLFCHDSAPELLFDRVLIEEMQREFPDLKVTSVVRNQRVLLDAMLDDAQAYGLESVVESIIDPGIPALGIPLNECSREFREVFEESDLIFAKGQAHFETLADGAKPSYFLMCIKCEVVARQQGVELGSLVLVKA